MAAGLGWTPTLSKENDAPVSNGLTGAHSGTRGLKVPLIVVPRRRLKKEKTERGPACWFIEAMPWTRGAATGPATEPLGLPCTLVHPYCRGWVRAGAGRDPHLHRSGTPHLARFSVTLLKASCFLARFLAAASLAIFSPNRSLRPGSKIYTTASVWVACHRARQSLATEAPASFLWPP